MNEGNEQLSLEQIAALLPEGYALVERDGWVPREQMEQELNNLKFDREIDLELTRCGAKNLTAARALLDLNAIRNDPGSMRSAVGKLRKESNWMFRSDSLMASGGILAPRREADTEHMSDAEYYAYRKQHKR